jgi:hypothetical protein
MGKIRARLQHELMEAIPPFLYFFAAFHLLAVVRALMQQEYGIQAGTVMNATIGALIVAKVVLPHFRAVQILMLVLFLQYCTLREISRSVGRQRMRAMFLRPLPGPES